MKVELLRGLNEEQKQEREQLLRSCSAALKVYKDALEARLSDLTKEVLSKKAYDNPAWALEQADRVGYARALNDLIELLTLDREKGN